MELSNRQKGSSSTRVIVRVDRAKVRRIEMERSANKIRPHLTEASTTQLMLQKSQACAALQ